MKNIPKKTITVRQNDKPWFTSELRLEIRKRDRLRKLSKNGSEHVRQRYKHQRNHVNNMKKAARQNFYCDVYGLIDQFSFGSRKEFWKLVKTLTKSSGNFSQIPPLLNPSNNQITVNDNEKADILNQYFCNISTIDDTNGIVPDFEMRTDSFIDNIDINTNDIIDVIKSLKTNKASGIDEISHIMLRNTAESVCHPLLLLFQRSLNTSTFPSLWQMARVMPIFKKGDRYLPSNYRPIALLSTVGKLFERLIHKHVHNFVVEHNLLYKLQSGFLPNNYTVYQLMEIYHSICLNLEDRKSTGMVFCDVSKAFDRVWHKGLLTKLRGYGISGNLLDFFNSYLSDRKQSVIVNSSSSSFLSTSAGVPQGSVFGPFLFLLYINDIIDNLQSIARLFADDTSMSQSSSNLTEIETVLNKDLDSILDWANSWKVQFNPQKTELLLFSNTESHLELKFGNSTITPSSSHKHLGLTFSPDSKWHIHIDNVCKSALKEINMLRKLKYTLSRKSLDKMYNTFILPILEYGCEVWDGCSKGDIDKLEKVNLEAARIVTGLPLFSSRESLYFETGGKNLKIGEKDVSLPYSTKYITILLQVF